MDTAEAASETAGIATAVSEQLAAAAEGGVLTEEQLRAAFEKVVAPSGNWTYHAGGAEEDPEPPSVEGAHNKCDTVRPMDPGWCAGASVRVVGLKSAAQHNGKVGQLKGRAADERLGVELEGGLVLSVRRENLELVHSSSEGVAKPEPERIQEAVRLGEASVADSGSASTNGWETFLGNVVSELQGDDEGHRDALLAAFEKHDATNCRCIKAAELGSVVAAVDSSVAESDVEEMIGMGEVQIDGVAMVNYDKVIDGLFGHCK